MKNKYSDKRKEGISLPISDWLLTFIYLCLYPLIFISVLSIIGYFVSEIEFLIILACITFFCTLFIVYFQISSHNELKEYALKVRYVHFKPSYKDNLLSFVIQVFSFSIQATILFLFLNFLLVYDFDLWFLLLIAGFVSASIQFFILVVSQLNKRKLFKTAQEVIPSSVQNYLNKNHPESQKISQYRFTDIKPASLFLSAGVTSSGLKISKGLKIDSTCFISRYFQWKLTDDELGQKSKYIPANSKRAILICEPKNKPPQKASLLVKV